MDFGSRLKQLRNSKKMSQQALADSLNISQKAISNYENNGRFPDQDVLKHLSNFFNVSLDYLIGTSDIKNPYNNEPHLPIEFTTPEEAVKFLLEQNVIMGFGGFDVDKLSDKEKIDFAKELLSQLKLLSYKYKKQE
ncbi:helix-turn-helix domain-containing protein [Tissierella praeacuta]